MSTSGNGANGRRASVGRTGRALIKVQAEQPECRDCARSEPSFPPSGRTACRSDALWTGGSPLRGGRFQESFSAISAQFEDFLAGPASNRFAGRTPIDRALPDPTICLSKQLRRGPT